MNRCAIDQTERQEPFDCVYLDTSMKITHRKVLDLTPKWAPFTGWTLILEPVPSFTLPETTLSLIGGLAVDTNGVERSKRTGFCPLPPTTYHITFLDLINEGNLRRVPEEYRPRWASLLAAANPKSGAIINDMISSKGFRMGWMPLELEFEFSRLEVLTASALVMLFTMRLTKDHDLAMHLRRNVGDYLSTYGIPYSDAWTPHVTLGYFANRDAPTRLVEQLSRLGEDLATRFQQRIVRAHGAHLYFFADMASYVPYR